METNPRNAEARAAIFASIRSGLEASREFDDVYDEIHAAHALHREALPPPATNAEPIVERFEKNVKAVGARCYVTKSEGEIREILAALTGTAKVIAISDSPRIQELVAGSTQGRLVENATSAELFSCDVGITEAQWAIAETGTLVIESNVERNRLTSLVPPVHVCLVSGDRIRATMGEILAETKKDLSPSMTFITGASRTSDIELTLAIGVHGPGELHVIVY